MQLFAGDGRGDGGGSAGGAVVAAAPTDTATAAASPQASGTDMPQAAAGQETVHLPASQKAAAKDEEGQATAQSAEDPKDRQARFNTMIKGEFKAEYQKSVEQAVKSRFGDIAAIRRQNKAMAPLLDLLSQKYNLDATDVKGITEALVADKQMFAAEAMRLGMDPEAYAYKMQLDMYKRSQERESAEQAEERRRNELVQRWADETPRVREKYPDFDLLAAMSDDRFMQLLTSNLNLSVLDAYEMRFRDEITAQAVRKAQESAVVQTVSTIQAQGSRPAENGTGSQGAPVIASRPPSQWSKEERERIGRDALRGKRYKF